MNLIWKKYYFKEFLKVFTLFIVCFYFLYIFIDYAAHAKSFSQEKVSFFDIGFYYLFQFTKRAEILVPFGLLIASIKVMTTANVRHEIVALTSSGVRLKTIVHPFLMGAFLCTCFLYVNFQYLLPVGLDRLRTFEDHFFHDKDRNENSHSVHQLILEDNSVLVYQSYHASENAFFDVFWLKHPNEFYRIKYLYPYEKVPLGRHVDQIVRTKKGDLKRVKTFLTHSFPQMQFDQKTLFTAVIPAQQQSVSDLFKSASAKKFAWKNESLNDREAQIATYFFYKLIIPILCFLIVIGVAPFCLKFGRHHPVFLIYAFSIFGLITVFTLMHSGIILGESKTLPPMVAILSIPLVLSLLLGWKFSRL